MIHINNTAARDDDSFNTAARGDDSSNTAARGVVSWGADIHSGSVVMTATGILM